MKQKRTNRSARRRDAHDTRIARKHAAHEKQRARHNHGEPGEAEPKRSLLPRWLSRVLPFLSGRR